MDPNVPCAYALRCECTHLTDFMGVAIPTSLDEVLAQLEPTLALALALALIQAQALTLTRCCP